MSSQDLEKGTKKVQAMSVGFGDASDAVDKGSKLKDKADDAFKNVDEEKKEEAKGFFDFLKDGVKYTKDSMETIKTRGESAVPFMVTFMSGLCSSCLACVMLPFIALMPGKVAFFFNLGAGLILISLALAKGWK